MIGRHVVLNRRVILRGRELGNRASRFSLEEGERLLDIMDSKEGPSQARRRRKKYSSSSELVED